MIRIMCIGLLAGLFFSTTFILNRAMSLEGGHWFWSASLRYGYMLAFLLAGLWCTQGSRYISNVVREFTTHWLFWTLCGSIGFGGFYALICFAADFAPGWVVATTWQLTIIASLVVLMLFGRSFSPRIWLFALIVFCGVFLVNVSQMESVETQTLLLGALPVLGAAFCYPMGNQLVWEAQNEHQKLPKINRELLTNNFTKVLLLTMGSLPFWCVLYMVIRPAPPSGGQLFSVALVALFSGVIATTLFLSARHRASNASELTAVDATQASEVIFALAGEVLFLGAALPNTVGICGMVITGVGLLAFAYHDHG